MDSIVSYFVWWFGCVKYLLAPVGCYMDLWQMPPEFRNGVPNGIIGVDICIIIAWVLLCELFGLISWGLLAKDKEIEDRHKTWEFWVGFLFFVVAGPAVFVFLVAVGAMVTGVGRPDKKERE